MRAAWSRTADPELARTVRLLRNQGMERRYENELIGFNTRMTDIHAAIGRVQLAKLAGWTAQRQANAAVPGRQPRNVVVPPVADGAVHVYHQYTIRVPAHDRDRFVAELGHARRRQRRLLPDPDPPAAVLRPRLRPARDRAGGGRGDLAAGAPQARSGRPGPHRRGRQRGRRSGCLMAAAERPAARRPDRPGLDGPQPRPGARPARRRRSGRGRRPGRRPARCRARRAGARPRWTP